MTNTADNNKRIAKNTLMLYVRMFVMMGVALFTSRVILQSLGVVDYGIYNVVAGFVSMFTFINSAMTSATQRYIIFAIEQGGENDANEVFCVSMNIHLLISVVFLLLAETLGLWFLNNHMVIPQSSMTAANIVYQLSILSTIALFIGVPYNALIVAHERMSAFAYISIFDVSIKLLIAFLIFMADSHRLVIYAFLMCLSQFIIRHIYNLYCLRHFKESKFHIVRNKRLFKELISFSGWSLFGNLASVAMGQGVNVLLNTFFGPIVNAARGVAIQVQNAVMGFSSNLQMAINPQITKNYASNNLQYMHKLIYASSKYSFFLLFILCLPIILEAKIILNAWLVDVPRYTVEFLRLTLIISMINALAGPFTIAAHANGNIKLYQSLVGGILLLTLPAAYLALKLGFAPISVYVVEIIVLMVAQIVRLVMMRTMIGLKLREYFKEVVFRITGVLFFGSVIPLILYLRMAADDFISFICVSVTCVVSVGASIFTLGINKGEREKVISFVGRRLKAWHNT